MTLTYPTLLGSGVKYISASGTYVFRLTVSDGVLSNHVNKTVICSFTDTVYTITASASVGGTITPTGAVSVLKSQSSLFMLTPGPGYCVSNIVVDGTSVGIADQYTFTYVQTNHTIAAVFQQRPPLQITTFNMAEGSLDLDWLSVANDNYVIERITNMVDGVTWTAVEANILATPPVTHRSIAVDDGLNQGFYRIRKTGQ